MAQQISFTSVIEGAAKLPFVRIDRTEFLTKNLSKLCTPVQLQKAITDGTLRADIPIETLDKLAKDVINAETIKVTAVSVGAGIPQCHKAIVDNFYKHRFLFSECLLALSEVFLT